MNMASTLLLALVLATVSVLLAIVLIGRFGSDGRRAPGAFLALRPDREARPETQVEPLAFLFRQNRMVDATAPARALLEILPGDGDWQRLMGWVSMHLPDAGGSAAIFEGLREKGRVELTSGKGGAGARLRACFEDVGDDYLRVMLSDPTSERSGTVVDSLTLSAMEEEIGMLRSAVDSSPMLAWREDQNGTITWANTAYLDLAERKSQGETSWPLPKLIELPARTLQPLTPRRAQIEDEGEIRWFECHSHSSGDQSVAIALPADAAVRAERSLREFVQTLTKTFADLPIGMAIFDRDRKLQLFNPALIDLTGLSAGFLTARPTLYAFLDRLREARMVPEPKDYRSWRNHMSTLESAAASGHHVETWSLPGGQTYRVTGRPHPDGAVAFLFEDITSEISLTRKFRADLLLGKEVLDGLSDAVAVFGGSGRLAMSNSVYDALWGTGNHGALAEHIETWRRLSGDGPGLQRLNELLDHPSVGVDGKVEVSGAMAGPSGGLLPWSIRYLTGGRVLVRFDASKPIPEIVAENMRARQMTEGPVIQDAVVSSAAG